MLIQSEEDRLVNLNIKSSCVGCNQNAKETTNLRVFLG